MSNANGSSLVFPTFLDVANDCKPWMNIPASNTQWDANLGLIVDMACQWVQNYLGKPIGPTSFTRRFDGWSGFQGAYLELPYYPVLEVTSVIEYWGVSGPHTLNESTPINQIDGWQCEYAVGRLIRVFPGNVVKPWFPGSRNVEVSWVAGYNPIPADIKLATLELATHWFRNTQEQSGVRTGIGIPASGEFDPAETSGGTMWTGVPYRIIDLLEPYLTIGIG